MQHLVRIPYQRIHGNCPYLQFMRHSSLTGSGLSRLRFIFNFSRCQRKYSAQSTSQLFLLFLTSLSVFCHSRLRLWIPSTFFRLFICLARQISTPKISTLKAKLSSSQKIASATFFETNFHQGPFIRYNFSRNTRTPCVLIAAIYASHFNGRAP